MMITYEWSDWRNGMIWWLQSVYVLPKHRRQGAFRAMYEFVTQLASADENVRGLRLYVEQHNENAQQTYRDLGMKESHYRMFEQMKPF
jgi:ribosomal protein S18 acetylase RimI-like enzyme